MEDELAPTAGYCDGAVHPPVAAHLPGAVTTALVDAGNHD